MSVHFIDFKLREGIIVETEISIKRSLTYVLPIFTSKPCINDRLRYVQMRCHDDEVNTVNNCCILFICFVNILFICKQMVVNCE